MTATTEAPWYKQFWPLFIIALPATVVVAGIATVILSFNVADDVVDPSYYEKGQAINTVLAQIDQARTMNMQADISTHDNFLTITLSGNNLEDSDTLVMALSHPLDKSSDRLIPLARIDNNRYRTTMPAILRDHEKWYIDIYPQNAQKPWLIKGTAFFPAESLTLVP